MKWLKYLGAALQVYSVLAKVISGWKQRRIGRIEAEHEQSAQDLETLRKAADARRDHDRAPGRMREDPHNRDAR